MNPRDTIHSFFAVSPPGIEAVTAGELQILGNSLGLEMSIREIKMEEGGVSFQGSWRDALIANIGLRTTSRILYRLSNFYAAHFNQLIKQIFSLPWEDYLDGSHSISIRVTCKKSRLYHSDAVAQRVLEGIQNRLKQSLSVEPWDETSESPPQLIIVRLVRDECSVSLDTSGAPLYHRGYRKETAKAPLREHLAAAMILSSGWDKKSPFIDPFCGSGTFLIEAALLAQNIAPGINRSFILEKWPCFLADKANVLGHFQSQIQPVTVDMLFGYDRDEGAIEISKRNAERAKVASSTRFQHQAISDLVPAETPGWIITNPPYGLRVSPAKDLRNLYARFGDVLRRDFAGWQIMILTPDPNIGRLLKLTLKSSLRFENGGLPVFAMAGLIR